MLARNLTPSPAPPQGGVPSSPERVKESPSDTGATSKKKTKTNPLACPAAGRGAIHSVVARRRMTTPVVNTPPDTGATSKKKNKNQPPRLPRRRAGCHPLCGG